MIQYLNLIRESVTRKYLTMNPILLLLNILLKFSEMKVFNISVIKK